MEEYFTLTVSHNDLYKSKKAKKIDWIEWCWQNIGQDNFEWTLDVSSRTDMKRPVHYVYYIRFRNDEDKLLFILNWL